MNDLTKRLADGDHPVAVGGPQPSLTDLKHRITDIGWVHVKFTSTRGGTDLAVPLDADACDLSGADFEQGRGALHLEGTLTLNYDRVRCVADIDLATLAGAGHLEPRSSRLRRASSQARKRGRPEGPAPFSVWAEADRADRISRELRIPWHQTRIRPDGMRNRRACCHSRGPARRASSRRRSRGSAR